MKLLHVVGARPNFPKLAPVHRAAKAAGLTQLVVHTGQHYDDALSGGFLRDLGLGEPDVNLEVGSDTHAAQTARIMERFEPVVSRETPDWVVVYGDVNSTVAAALVAVKLGVRVAHVEAGLRSFDRTMPEEINRIVTDRLANLLLTPSRDADAQLRSEGEPEDEIAFVGNVMVDSLFHSLAAARATKFRHTLRAQDAVIVTLHRPSNVDDPARLRAIMRALDQIATTRPVIFPAHPRTRARLDGAGIVAERTRVLAPVSYFEMLDLIDGAHAVITDSGGVQEETTALGVPCFTIRANTERPITISEGTNQLVPEPEALAGALAGAPVNGRGEPRRPEGWDGKAGERVVAALRSK
ncbi:MAG TPA: UDP-N-acetylglucosamine 2-epimerase (non-hydrolyzing) [Gemmatimonadaceae bacterium]|nr:UDP-N-acetylglucosamine 2-epimerase (non-hydrolyzing) [Gemmatimonadaceae bacterium]